MEQDCEKRCRELARAQYGVISRAQAMQQGMPPWAIRRRVAAGRWDEVDRDVVRLAPDGSWRQQVKAATLACAGAVASRRTAAAVYPFGPFPQREIEVVTSISRPRRARSFVVHRTNWLPDSDVTIVRGIPVTTPSRTILDLGDVVGPRMVARAIESALRKDLVTLPQLVAQLDSCGKMGRPGTAILRGLLADYGSELQPRDSELEAAMLRVIEQAGLPLPQTQYEVWDGDVFLGTADAAYPEHRIALEADGYEFHSARPDWQRDRWRQNAWTGRGWRILRFTVEDAERPRVFLNDLTRALGPLSAF
jgi:hypothetical protein